MFKLTQLHHGVVLGVLLGLLGAGWPPRLATAQATLCFSPRVKLPRYIDIPEKTTREEPLSWADTILSSKGAINYLCSKFEASSLSNKGEIVREACLLTAEKRIHVESYQENCLRLQIQAQQPEVALILCQNLVGYLALQSQQTVEKEADYRKNEVQGLEKQLRTLEKSLSRTLWLDLALDAKPRDLAERQETTLELTEFARLVQEYRDGVSDRFFGEIQAAARVPTFSVLEPAYLVVPPKPWAQGAALGGLAGLLLSGLARWNSRRPARPQRPAPREPWIVRRNPNP